MNLKVPIQILDELAETVIRSTGSLDLASGEIFDVRYEVDRPGLMGMPAVDEQYEFTSGVLSNDGKDVEFRIEVFNLFDHTNFQNPVGTLPNALPATPGQANTVEPGQPFTPAAAATFGKLTSTVGKTVGLGTNRQVQFALRVNF